MLSNVLACLLRQVRLSGSIAVLFAAAVFLTDSLHVQPHWLSVAAAQETPVEPPGTKPEPGPETKTKTAAADSTPRSRIDPAGIGGSLLLAGEQVSDEVLERFLEAGGGKDCRLVILRTGDSEPSREVTARLLKHWEVQSGSGMQVLRLDLPPSAGQAAAEKPEQATEQAQPQSPQQTPTAPVVGTGTLEAIRQASAVWLAVDDDAAVEGFMSLPELGAEVQQVIDRGGIVGGSVAVARWLGSRVLASGAGETASRPALGLLPDAVVEISSANLSDQADASEGSRLSALLALQPALVGYEIDSTAALLLRGRILQAVGEGDVRVHLAESPGRPARQWTLDRPQRIADLTSLRRAARTRAAANFPPEKPEPAEVEGGTLIIIGGGGMPRGIVERFVELAGGADGSILVLPTANPDPLPPRDGITELFRKAGAGKVTVLPGRTLTQVESDEYLTAFREATGIWFGGGRQWRFVDAYQGTKAQELMLAMLRRGGVVMGSSAGASIQAEYLARGNPLGNLDVMAEGYEQGLGFLKGAAVDQHFAQRKRFSDMTSLVRRYPQLLGIGIDETTALVVQGRHGEIVGRGAVHFFDAARPVVEGQPDYESVPAGGRYDLVAREVVVPEEKK